jgi:hypothetical protein
MALLFNIGDEIAMRLDNRDKKRPRNKKKGYRTESFGVGYRSDSYMTPENDKLKSANT